MLCAYCVKAVYIVLKLCECCVHAHNGDGQGQTSASHQAVPCDCMDWLVCEMLALCGVSSRRETIP